MLCEKFLEKADYSDYYDLKKNYKICIPENFNFAYDVADFYALQEPERRALVWCNDAGEEKIFTFGQLMLCVNKTANFLKAHGIKKGDTVLLILRRRYEFWFFILALHKIGAIAVPATQQLLANDICYRNNAADIKMIVSFNNVKVQEEIEKSLQDNKCPSVKELVTVSGNRTGWTQFYSEYEMCSSSFRRPSGKNATCNEDVMLLYFTSGTSGEPKMVQHNFAYPLGHIVTARYWQNVVDGGLHLTVAETGWAKAVWGKLYGQWLCGSAVFAYDMESFVPDRLLRKMEQYGVTTFCAPPTVYRYLIRQDLSKYNLSSLKYAVTAGEALNDEVFKKFREMTGLEMHEAYGQTECTVLIGNFSGMQIKPGSMGRPAPGYEIDIVDEEGNSCGANESGEIVIRFTEEKPFGLFSGYFNNKEQTEKAFANGMYRTGDIAYFDEDGYFWFVGRADDVIKSSGYRISPFEVESVLLKHPAVLECAVTGVSDKKRGQIVKATVVLNENYTASPLLVRELQEFAKKNMALYKHPRIVEFAKELPKTISGKIKRVEIRKKNENTPAIKQTIGLVLNNLGLKK